MMNNKCKFCNGEEDISNKIFDDGSTYSDCIMKVFIEKDVIYGWCLKVRPVKYVDGEKRSNETHCFNNINYCPICGRKLCEDNE